MYLTGEIGKSSSYSIFAGTNVSILLYFKLLWGFCLSFLRRLYHTDQVGLKQSSHLGPSVRTQSHSSMPSKAVAYVGESMHRGQRPALVVFLGSHLFFLETGSLFSPVWELSEQARLAGQRALEIWLSLFFQCELITAEFLDRGSKDRPWVLMLVYWALYQSSYLPSSKLLCLLSLGPGGRSHASPS